MHLVSGLVHGMFVFEPEWCAGANGWRVPDNAIGQVHSTERFGARMLPRTWYKHRTGDSKVS
jgi:hypothetical protein